MSQPNGTTAQSNIPDPTLPSFTKGDIEGSIPELFEKQVERFPHRLALKTMREELTYAELNQAANRIAHAILLLRGQKIEPIALLLENHIPLITAIIAVLKCGKFYVPLDSSLPSARMRDILEDSQASLILTNNKNLARARDLSKDRHLLNIDELKHIRTTENIAFTIPPDSLTWILYTSGSTGQPKGVVQTHRNVLHFIWNYAAGLHLCSGDRLTLLYSCAVNFGAHNLLIALLSGLPLYSVNIREEGASVLPAWLVRHEITIYFSAPTVFRHFVNILDGTQQFSRLRIVQLAGEPVWTRDLEAFRKHFPEECVFVNRLGSTETGTIRWYFVDKTTVFEGDVVPVGYPVEDNEIVLLGEDGKKVGFNEVGEIAVRSRYLTPGYWRRPDLTQKAFLPDPEGGDERLYLTGDLGCMRPDGCLSYKGRKDFQVKIRGYRVETEEIELALVRNPTIKEAVVVSREDSSGNQRLIAYCVPHSNDMFDVPRLRRELAETLADYMIPSLFVQIDAIPQTPNGKVDRRGLPAPGRARPTLEVGFSPPRTLVETRLAQMWAEVLDLDQVGVRDSFLELGGNSLQATQIISRVTAVLRIQLSLRTVFEDLTVEKMAERISQEQLKSASPEELNDLLAELRLVLSRDAQGILEAENPEKR